MGEKRITVDGVSAEAARERFRMAQPRMCLYCRGGWLVVPTLCAGAGGLAVACTHADHRPKQPKTISGWKVPPRAETRVLLAPNCMCEKFTPIEIDDEKALAIERMGLYDGLGDTPLPSRWRDGVTA